MASEVLRKIGEIDVPRNPSSPAGLIKLDVAKNSIFHLVESDGIDAYGNPKCEVFQIVDRHSTVDTLAGLCSGLVQVIGSLIIERDALAAQLASAVRMAKE